MHRRIAAGLAASIALVLLCPPATGRQTAPSLPHFDQVPVRIYIEFYDVEGRSARALDRSLQFSGPLGYAADTRANMSFNWQYERAGETCTVTQVDIPLDVTIRYPRWVGLERANRQMRADWERRMAILEVHENGHAVLAFVAAVDLYNELVRFGRNADCEGLDAGMSQVMDAAMAALRLRQREYDRITEHGNRQAEYDWTMITGSWSD